MKPSNSALIITLSLLGTIARAEVQNVAPGPNGPIPQPYQAAPAQQNQDGRSVLSLLRKKLSRDDGSPATLVILDPLDYTGVKLAGNIKKILERGLTLFTKVNLKQTDYQIEELTLDAFRNAVIETEADVMVATVLKPTGFEIFLYDVRNPFVIYTYAHTLPDPRIHQYAKDVVIKHTKQLIARLLNNYVKEIYYELPRGERTIASFEGNLAPDSVPRGPAATELFFDANRDRLSQFYASASMGYFMSKGTNGIFNSSIFTGQVGWVFSKPFAAEISVDMTTYNIGTLSLKYLGESETSQWRYLLGLGIGYATAKFTANWDQTNGIGFTSIYVVPSAAVFFPISHTAYLKGEVRAYVGLPPERLLLSFLPGLVVRF
ncbi:MAG: hypothetical protein KDD51_10615 [Bdellovibrionales bacterium]|nr:hypothetical protein [Bdellovibrionales bacterium]